MIRLYLAGYKGLSVISGLPQKLEGVFDDLVIAKDPNVKNDYYEDIERECIKRHLTFYNRISAPETKSEYNVAIGWRWLINTKKSLIVFHDSLLPRLRGFNPLVTALINGDKSVGVTSLLADDKYDNGPIINQKAVQISYPIKIEQAIKLIAPLYTELFLDLLNRIEDGDLKAKHQNVNEATFSLWRDKDDYLINWSWDSNKIKRFIDAVGYPYLGAKTYLESEFLTIRDCDALKDLTIENRVPGKVIFKDEKGLTIVCGEGLLRIKKLFKENGQLYDYSGKFRMRFHSLKRKRHPIN